MGMVTRPRLPSKGLTLRWQTSQWSRLSLVRPLDGNALILASPGINPIQYGLFLKHYGMGGGALWPPCNFAVS